MTGQSVEIGQSGRYSALRYPGGKGKIVRFVRDIIRINGLSDGRYVEPYAGGAAVAWELLLTGVVRRIAINDISRPVFAFWSSVLDHTDELCRLIEETPVTVDQWDRCKAVFKAAENEDQLRLGFSFFFLNRTNRSGILNGGIIGGRLQTGDWKIDARYNKADLIARIQKIATMRSKVELTQMDAVEFLEKKAPDWKQNTLIYVDPPYYEKGRYLYHDAYRPEDHSFVATAVKNLRAVSWIVSYDDVMPIHSLYKEKSWLQYTLNYSARNSSRGREAMFFSEGLQIPPVSSPLIEIDREIGDVRRAVEDRNFAA